MAANYRRVKSDEYEGKSQLWSAELPTICGEYYLMTCVGFHPICSITVVVCVLKLQYGRSFVPQIGRRGKKR